MRLFVLVTLVMIAFAANSVLNRMALVEGDSGPAAFALVRLGAGALVLVGIAMWRAGGVAWPWLEREQGRGAGRFWGAAALALYVLGFSFAYVTLDAGVGALILFGGVQITMFAGAAIQREAMTRARLLGAAIAFGGLVVLLWPHGAAAPDPVGAGLMTAAALGWGIYSLLGRGSRDPLGATAANFALALPVAMLCFALFPDTLDRQGIGLAVVSGAVTSGAGYALWYSVLPRLTASVAAVSQLSVPLIAFAGGLVLLDEPLTLRFALAAALVLCGIGLSLGRGLVRPVAPAADRTPPSPGG
jgi:drug/metabolite transporter (DMT)-like permease